MRLISSCDLDGLLMVGRWDTTVREGVALGDTIPLGVLSRGGVGTVCSPAVGYAKGRATLETGLFGDTLGALGVTGFGLAAWLGGLVCSMPGWS
jgi:hypothetical protein